jgi:hypothetical protein
LTSRRGGSASICVPDKTISSSRQGLNESRCICPVAQRLAQSLDGIIYSTIKVHKRVGWPNALPQFLPGHDLARLFEKHLKNLEGLFLQSDLSALLAQLSRTQINFEDAEANNLGWTGSVHGGEHPHCRAEFTTVSKALDSSSTWVPTFNCLAGQQQDRISTAANY